MNDQMEAIDHFHFVEVEGGNIFMRVEEDVLVDELIEKYGGFVFVFVELIDQH